jgi:hypothetical protein
VKTKRTEITVETFEVLLFRAGNGTRHMSCAECGETVRALKPEEAAGVTNVMTRAIYRWVEAGILHFQERPDGTLLICDRSLTQRRKESLP